MLNAFALVAVTAAAILVEAKNLPAQNDASAFVDVERFLRELEAQGVTVF